MSDDTIKVRFFQTLLTEMRKENPEFGRGCYVDSTPLPGEAENNPFNALSNHGTGGAEMQSRLVLVLDIQTNIPLWFEIIPANVLDKSTLQSISADVKATLGVTIFMFAPRSCLKHLTGTTPWQRMKTAISMRDLFW